MAKFEKRQEARILRKKGFSVKSISDSLGVSKSSASIWCRDLVLTDLQKELLRQNAIKAGNKGRIIGAEMNRKKKEDQIKFYNMLGKKTFANLSERDLLSIGVGLYWGEGSKGAGNLSFSNSDPEMIKFVFRWFQRVMKVRKDEFMPRIFINQTHKPRIRTVLKFWSSLLDLPEKQFGNPAFIKTKQKKIYENHDSYYGVLSLRVRKSTELRYHILGLINGLKS